MNSTESLDGRGLTSTWRSLTSALRAGYGSFDRFERHEQACLLTLPLLLLYIDEYWYVNVPVVGLALAGIIFPNVRISPLYWFTLTCFAGAAVYYNWLEVDNHKYLLVYWCLAIFCALSHPKAADCLAISARYLIALTFSLAAFWKLWSPDFLNGNFFHFEFLFDSRFEGKLKALGLADPKMLELNEIARRALTNYDSSLSDVQLVLDASLQRAAVSVSWWALVMEAAIALAFLIPVRWRISGIRHVLLLAFVISTYAIAPVIGFGWLLIIMGFVQCDRSVKTTRLLYLLSLLVLQAFRLPWSAISDSLAR
ncbi:MAG: hypothetical protein ACREEM_19130 [Blastocatellia bacterium]